MILQPNQSNLPRTARSVGICGARTNAVLPAGERLGDGSYLGQIVAAGDHCHASAPVTVRVVECGLDDPAAPQTLAVCC
jgi:hypothetical protein